MGGSTSREEDSFAIPAPSIVDVRDTSRVQQAQQQASSGSASAPAARVGISEARQAVKTPITFLKDTLKVDAGGVLSFQVKSSVDFSVELYTPALEAPQKSGDLLRWPRVTVGKAMGGAGISSVRMCSKGEDVKVCFDQRGEAILAGEKREKGILKDGKTTWPFAVLLWPGHSSPTEEPPDGVVLAFCVFDKERPRVSRQLVSWGGLPQEVFQLYGVHDVTEEQDDDAREKLCVVCMTDPRDTALLPCGHFCVCYDCAKHIRLSPSHNQCPMCRAKVADICQLLIEAPAAQPEEQEKADASDDEEGEAPKQVEDEKAQSSKPAEGAEAPKSSLSDVVKMREARLKALEKAAPAMQPPAAADPAPGSSSSSSSAAATALPARCLSRLGRELKIAETERKRNLEEHGIELMLSDPAGANLQAWTLKLHAKSIDKDSLFFKELQRTQTEVISFEVWITSDYPGSPPKVRVLDPCFGSGSFFVFSGALCMEILTKQGWNPAVSLSQLGVQIKTTMTQGKGTITGRNRTGGHGAGEREAAWKAAASVEAVHTDWKQFDDGSR